MEKTTVYLTAAQKEALGRAARAEGRSEARLIRAGIDVVTARHRAAEAEAAIPYPAEADAAGAASATPGPSRPRWMPRDAFVQRIVAHQADANLRAELRDLAPDLTADLPDR
jgi:hypothetical protein